MPVTPDASIPPPPRLRRLHLALDIAIGLLLVIAVLTGLIYWYVRSDQPHWDGRLRLQGLRAPVSIVRDNLGIPHIQAQNIHDLYMAQGFAMAQDRLWQMDLMRRLGEGRLAEVFGPVALDVDRKNRELGLGRTAAAEAARMQPQEAALLTAFAAGVNSFITDRGRRLPLEFWLLRYRPEAWTPRDSLALAAYMYQVLGSDYDDKLLRETITARIGPGLAQQLFPRRSAWDVVPGALGPRLGPQFGSGLPVFAAPPPRRNSAAAWAPGSPQAAASLGGARGEAVLGPAPRLDHRGGSNDWVLAGMHSFTGKPILANDPHLQFQIPGLWWTAQLSAPGVDVAGVAIAGVPGIVIGHNQHIAWGVTNTRADVQDLYRETFDGKGNVLTPRGWQPLRHWHESIGVRGAAPVPLDVTVTPHGPVIARDAGGPLALAWSMYAPGALQATHIFLAIDQAQNFAQFESALSGFAGPTQNFVYADDQGHIAYQCAGWVPLRQGYDGSVPVPGNTASLDWHGWIPFGQLPRVQDPAAGVLATANSRITPDGYPYTISTDWDAPNRTRRIYQLLSQLPRWNASAMGRLQQDVYSEQDRDFAAALIAAGEAVTAAGTRLPVPLQQALRQLRGFRGAMGHTATGPTLAYQARREFLRRVLSPKLGDPLARRYNWDEAPVFEQWLLAAHPPQWLPPDYAGRGWNGLLLDSLASVVESLGNTPSDQHWGRFETLSVQHPVWSHFPVVRNFADLGPVELNGSPLTVKQARNVALGDPNDLGPSMRFVADVGAWDRSTVTLVAGESGQLFNPHYRDQYLAYLRGVALPLWFSPAAVAAHRQHRLELVP